MTLYEVKIHIKRPWAILLTAALLEGWAYNHNSSMLHINAQWYNMGIYYIHVVYVFLTGGVLTEDHLSRLMTVLSDAAYCSFLLGIQLRLNHRDVKTLEYEAGRNSSIFLSSVLSKWLQRRDPPPTVEELVATISRPPLNDKDLAHRLKEEFGCT